MSVPQRLGVVLAAVAGAMAGRAPRARALRPWLAAGTIGLVLIAGWILAARTPAAVVSAAAGCLVLAGCLWFTLRQVACRAAALEDLVRQTADQLQRAQGELDNFFKNAAIGFHTADSDGRISRANRADAEIVGIPLDEYVGRNVSEFHDDQLVLNEAFHRLRQGERLEGFQAKLRQVDGSMRHVLIDAVPHSADGRFVGADCFTRDITEFVKSQQEAATYMEALESTNSTIVQFMAAADAANRSKSEFLANMSHEIRTPMTAILGFAEVLTGSALDAQQLDAVRTIKRNGEYLLELINDILDLSKIEADRVEVERISCSPSQIVRDVVALMQLRAHAKGLSLSAESSGRIPETIHSDPTRLRQILINLVGNAVKFTEVGGVRIIVSLRRFHDDDEPILRFDVVDSGIGLTPEQAARLFRPFTQADASTSRKYGGTGLGLTICKRLAAILGGDIALSTAPGMGSTFSVSIATGPLDGVRMLECIAADDRAAARDALAATPAALPANCRVLLVEDGPDNQRLISFVLTKAGAQVSVVENGQMGCEQALAALAAGCPFDVILMDMQMPVLDGYAATGRLRQAGYHGPIVALTAHAMSEERERCLKAGCDEYQSKPIDRARLLQCVARFSRNGAQPDSTRSDSPAVRTMARPHHGPCAG